MITEVARGAGFDGGISPVPLRVRIYDFLSSKRDGASRREVAEALGENPNRVGDFLRRLWKRGFVLRTREPVYKFESWHKGSAASLC